MTKKGNQIECLDRLQAVSSVMLDILNFLKEEKVMSVDELDAYRKTGINGKTMQSLLHRLSTGEKLQLLEYEWQLLPIERIKLTIVTDRNSKEFSYEGA